jgi:hypothetical protein
VLQFGFLVTAAYGAVTEAENAWLLGDIGVGMMAWLNIIAILVVAGPALRALRDYERQKKAGLDPQFDPNAAIQAHVAEILRRRMLKQASPSNLFRTALEVNEAAQRVPGVLNKVLDRISRNELELKVDAFDEVHFMEGIQKIANRIASGLVLAALIVGAALLVQVDTGFTILGYPGLAILLFLGAVLGGVVLLIDIIQHDEKSDKRKRR